MKKICIIPFLALFLFSCQKDNPDKDNSVVQLTTKEQAKNQSELDRYINQKLTIPYNVNINYRYPENDINRNQCNASFYSKGIGDGEPHRLYVLPTLLQGST